VAGQVGGVYKYRTAGRNTTEGLAESLHLISVIGGKLAGIPLNLVCSQKRTLRPDGAPTTVTIVRVEYKGGIQELRETASKIAIEQQQHNAYIKQIEDNMIKQLDIAAEVIGDEEEFAEEFTPDAIAPEIDEPEDKPKEEKKNPNHDQDMTEEPKEDDKDIELKEDEEDLDLFG